MNQTVLEKTHKKTASHRAWPVLLIGAALSLISYFGAALPAGKFISLAPPAILCGGLAATGILALYFKSLADKGSRSEAAVQESTLELKRSTAGLLKAKKNSGVPSPMSPALSTAAFGFKVREILDRKAD